MRLILQYVLPLIAPFAIFWAWYLFANRGTGKSKIPHWEDGPWFWLFVSGAGLTMTVALVLAFLGGAEPGSTYHPARMENGQVVPGYMEK